MTRKEVPTQIGLKIEDEGDEVERLQNYLRRFGYIRPEMDTMYGLKIDLQKVAEIPEPKVFDNKTQQALRGFQEFNKLPITGVLDKATINLMLKPRCSMPDFVVSAGEVDDYVYSGRKWAKMALTYMYDNFTPDLTQTVVRRALRGAFDQWDSKSCLSFSEAKTGADITLSWESGDHGDGYPFDGTLGVLAHAFYPEDGRIHFDEDELWTDDNPPSGIDLASVALHEIGHSLGLAHSNDTQAVMYAYYGGRRRDLRSDDIAGIQSIYGKGPCCVATTVAASSLPVIHTYAQFLRVFRDEIILKSAYRNTFEEILDRYYGHTPFISKRMESSPMFRNVVKCIVFPFVIYTKWAASLALSSTRHRNHTHHMHL